MITAERSRLKKGPESYRRSPAGRTVAQRVHGSFDNWLAAQGQIGNSAVARMLDIVQRCGVHTSCSSEGQVARLVQRQDDAVPVDVAPVRDVSGQGQAHRAVAFGPANVTLKGKTSASFDGGRFHTEEVITEAGEGCKTCQAKQCVHVTGNIVSAYRVTTNVSLPSMAQFKNLTPCQREAVRQAIQDQLAPHEQEHVAAFGRYSGTSSQPFDLTTCRAAFAGKVDAMARAEEKQRRAEAQAASDALDPFQIDVDLNCSDDA